MNTHATTVDGKTYHYYKCFKANGSKRGICRQRAIRAERVEPVIWEWFASESKDPERIREGFDALIEHERSLMSRGDPEAQARVWAEQIAERARLRAAYQDQQAAGLMTLEELGSKLAELEERRHSAERALADVRDAKVRIEALESERDALIAAYAERLPEDLECLTGEERNAEYRRFEIEVTPPAEPGDSSSDSSAGGYRVTGIFCAPESLSRSSVFSTVSAAWAHAGAAISNVMTNITKGRTARDLLSTPTILRACYGADIVHALYRGSQERTRRVGISSAR
jgi:hypothetical protein